MSALISNLFSSARIFSGKFNFRVGTDGVGYVRIE